MIFVTLSKLVPGRGTDFVDALRRGIVSSETLPGTVRVVSAFVTYGQYDLVLTLEAPDLSTANDALKELLTSGIVSAETLVGQTIDEFIS